MIYRRSPRGLLQALWWNKASSAATVGNAAVGINLIWFH